MTAIRRVLAALSGLVFGLLGALAVFETGVRHFEEHVEVVGLHHTGLLGWIQVAYGLLLLAAAASWGAGASTGFLGALGAAFGFVVLIAGDALHDSLGVHAQNGVLYVALGGLVALFGFLTVRPDDRYGHEHVAEP